MGTSRPKIAVIGSMNMDLVVCCRNLPAPGQTILANSSSEICGGKGANQAVAAARAGGDVTMIGRVGDDAFASRLVANLQDSGIRTEYVLCTKDCASGLAVVAVEDSGQNSIMVVPGSNGQVCVDDIENARSVIESSSVVLLQLEIPIAAVEATIRLAKDAGVRVILDPAPAPDAWPDSLFQADLLCPNESEAAAFLGRPVENVEQAEVAARAFHAKGAANVAITLGDQGTLLFDGQQAHLVSPYTINAVDSTAAGDAFAGALAVYWAEHNNLVDAVRFGNAAGALSASRRGAQPSMGSRNEIERLWSSQ
jgi:ribokinase